ncbi:MAG TPA: hypothetical protein VGC31_02530 [Paenirhodobacter sp.]
MLDDYDRLVLTFAPWWIFRPAQGGTMPGCPHRLPGAHHPQMAIWRDAIIPATPTRPHRNRIIKRVANTRFFHVRGAALGKEAA